MDKTKRYLVTGAAGSVGSALLERLVNDGHTVCAFDNNEEGIFHLKKKFDSTPSSSMLRYFLGDIRDPSRLRRAFEEVDVVIHCAALKHVEMSEINSMEAIETNINGTKNVIDACLDSKVARAVFTSSDKSVNPTSTMGATKLIGERLFTSANNLVGSRDLRFSTIRFGNVLDSSGSVLKLFKNSYLNGQPFTLTELDMTRFFLTMTDAVDLCIYAEKHAIGGEIFVKSMGTANIMKLAQAVANSESIEYIRIGKKVGEKLWEDLITDVEATRTVKQDAIYTVVPELALFTNEKLRIELNKAYGDSNPVNSVLSSKSDNLSWQELRSIFTEYNII
jgi:UDP-N-acetylglucosamine 4,6-dehydratase